MELRILGPLEVVEGGVPVDVGAPKERAVLARLLLDANTVVSTDRILEDLWPDGPPRGGARSLHVHIARLRRVLERSGDAAIVTVAPGYVLEVDRDAVDAMKFERLSHEARERLTANPRHAAAMLRRAIGLWRGPALADFTYEPFAEGEIRRLEEMRLAAGEDLIEAELALGNHTEVTGRLDKLVTEHPLRERLWGLRMVALYQGGRQAEALRAFQEARRTLVEGLGVEPSEELQNLEARILLHDTALLVPATRPWFTSDLPLRLSSFVGRWRDEAALRRLINEHRLVTVTGVAGVGKTSLAVETARGAASDYADGVHLVPLGGLDVDALVPDEVVRALGQRVADRQSGIRVLRDFLATRQTLLILDNCEHLLVGTAGTVDELLQGCPQLHILATSREPLGVDGEIVYDLTPLVVPPDDVVDLDELQASPAVQMFVDRAASSQLGFALRAGNRRPIAHICRSVAGIPLAIELAAARLRSMSPTELADHMGGQLGILTDGRRTAPLRHRSLEATMDVSYGLLTKEDRALLRRTCVFRGGFTVEDAAFVSVGRERSEMDVLDGLGSLVGASLLVAEQREEETRFRQLEPVRQYGAEQLDRSGEDHATRFRHATWFAAKARAIQEHAEAGRMDRVLVMGHRDRENFREALRWSLDAGENELSLTLTSGLAPFWSAAGPKAEGYAWLEAALAASPEEVTGERFRAVCSDIQLGISGNEPVGDRLAELDRMAGALSGPEPRAKAAFLRAADAWSRGNLVEAINLADESRRLTEEAGARLSTARRLLGECLTRIGDFDEAERLMTELDRWNEEHGRTRDYGLVENLGMNAYARGDLAEAERLVEEAVKGFGSLESRSAQMDAMSYLAWITIDLGKEQRTRLLAERALTMAREDGEVMIEANCLWILARLALGRRDTAGARSLLDQCVSVAVNRRERIVLVLALHVYADLAYVEGDADMAVRLFAAADRHRRAIPHVMPSSVGDRYDRELADVRRTLGDDAVDATWAEGTAMTLNDAVTLAIGVDHERRAGASGR